MKSKVTWVLVADSAHAKIFAHGGPGSGLTPVPDLMFEEEPKTAGEIMSDRPGRSFASVGPGRSSIEPHTDPVAIRKSRFMQAIANRLDEKLQEGAFDRLIVAAAPAALGDIRPLLSPAVAATIMAELPKDLAKIPTEALTSHFEDILAV